MGLVASVDEHPADSASLSRTGLVVLLLVAAAALLSFLATYGVVGVLVEAEVLPPWPPQQDPRPRWLAVGFAGLLSVFLLVAVAVRQLSRWQLRQIDAMAD